MTLSKVAIRCGSKINNVYFCMTRNFIQRTSFGLVLPTSVAMIGASCRILVGDVLHALRISLTTDLIGIVTRSVQLYCGSLIGLWNRVDLYVINESMIKRNLARDSSVSVV